MSHSWLTLLAICGVLLLHLRCPAQPAPTVLPTLPATPEVLIQQLRAANAQTRADAARELGRQCPPQGFTALVEVVQDPDPTVRQAVYTALGQYPDDPRLVEVMLIGLKDAEPTARRTFIDTFRGRMYDERLIPSLIAVMKSDSRYPHVIAGILSEMGSSALPSMLELAQDPNASSRAQALRYLGNFHDRRVIPILLDHLKNDLPDNQANAAEALANFDDPDVKAGLLAALAQDAEIKVRIQVAIALLRHPDQQVVTQVLKVYDQADRFGKASIVIATSWSRDPCTMPIIDRALQAEDVMLPLHALHSLMNFYDPQVLDYVLMLLNAKDPMTVYTALMILQRNPDARAVSPLCDILWKEATPEHIRALANLTDGRELQRHPLTFQLNDFSRQIFPVLDSIGVPVLPLLYAGARDAKAEKRAMAAVALGNMHWRAAQEPLNALVVDQDELVSAVATRMLGLFADVQSIPTLLDACKDARATTRAQAAWALGNIRDTRAREALLALLHDPSADVQYMTVYALGQLADDKVTPALVEQVKNNPDVGVRLQAVKALAIGKDPHAVQPLLALLPTADTDKFGVEIVQALGDIGDNSAYAPLLKVAQNGLAPRGETRLAAIGVLGKVGGKAAFDPLLAFLADAATEFTTIKALADFPEARVITALQAAANVAGVADSVVAALARMGEAGYEPLSILLQRADPQGQLRLLNSLSSAWRIRDSAQPGFQVTDRHLAEVILPLLRCHDLNMKNAVYGVLNHFTNPTATPMLLDLLRMTDFQTASVLVSALGKTHDPRAASRLMALTAATTPYQTRLAAIAALGNLGAPAAAATLKALAPDTDPAIRVASANALGLLKDPTAFGTIQQVYATANPAERSGLIAGLGASGEPRAVEMLSTLRAGMNSYQTGEIARALSNIADARATRVLVDMVRNAQFGSNVRSVVMRALVDRHDPLVTDTLLALLGDPRYADTPDDSRYPGVREMTATMLAERQDPRIIPALLAALPVGTLHERLAIAQALIAQHATRATTALTDALTQFPGDLRSATEKRWHGAAGGK